MPKLHHIDKLTEHLAIGVQVGKNNDNSLSKSSGMWTARFTYPRQRPKFSSLKLKYEAGSATNKSLAVDKAYRWVEGIAPLASAGKDYHSKHYLNEVAEDYLKDIQRMTDENEARKKEGQPYKHKVSGGTGFWHKRMLNQTNTYWEKVLLPFFAHEFATPKTKTVSLANKVKGGPRILKEVKTYQYDVITNLKKRDWDKLDAYILSQEDLSQHVEYRLKSITNLRKFLSWAFHKEIIDDVPSIERPSRGGLQGVRERMRRCPEPEEYTAMIEYQRSLYMDNTRPKYYREWNYLFHLWTLIISNTGIRPPTGNTPHTMMRWEHVNIDTDKPTLLRPNEKGHRYEAVIMPNAVTYFEELKNFYTRYGMPTDKGYCFAHWRDQGDTINYDDIDTYMTKERRAGEFGKLKDKVIESHQARPAASYIEEGDLRWKRGDPIQTFRSQWTKMQKALDMHVKGGQQKDNLSPSSLRAWFITQRLYSDENFRIEELARVTGTSVEQIEARYFRLDMSRSYEHLTAGGYDRGDKKPTYTEDGMYAGFK